MQRDASEVFFRVRQALGPKHFQPVRREPDDARAGTESQQQRLRATGGVARREREPLLAVPVNQVL